MLGSTVGVSGEVDRSGVAAGVEKVEAKRLSMIDGMYSICQVIESLIIMSMWLIL